MSDAILAIDTSSGTRVAVVSAGKVLAERSQADPRAHAEHVSPLVLEALSQAGLAVSDLRGIAVGTGPAPFTGLRVGIATAQLLGLAAGIPVWGVPSLDAWAAAALAADPHRNEVLVATDARRKEVYTARYERVASAPGAVRQIGEFAVHRPQSGPDGVPQPSAGTAAALYPAAYSALSDGTAAQGEPAGQAPVAQLDPAYLAVIGAARAAAGENVALAPHYLRRPDVHGVQGAPEVGTGASTTTTTTTTTQQER